MTTITIREVTLLIPLARNELSTAESWLSQGKRDFSDCTPEQMLQPVYGTSGQSRADIIAAHQARRDRARQLFQELEDSL